MKKLIKVVLFIMLLNLLLGVAFLGWTTISLVGPSFKGTGITFSDIFKKHLEPEKYQKLEQNISIESEKLGKEWANKFIKVLNNFLPIPNYQLKESDPKYPYPSIDDVMKKNEESAQEGIDQGFKALDDMNKKNQSIIDKSLSTK